MSIIILNKFLDNFFGDVRGNKMLKQIVNVLNYYISHAREENEHDFGRNVLANLISNVVDLRTIRGRR